MTTEQASAELLAFARDLQGPYAERFDAILERAFQRHEKLIRTGHELRFLAGGGTNPVAQAALDRFERRLVQLTAGRLPFSSALPASLQARMSTAMQELWAEAKKEAAAEFDGQRTELTMLLTQAQQLAETRQQGLASATLEAQRVAGELATVRAEHLALAELLQTSRQQLDTERRRMDELAADHRRALLELEDLQQRLRAAAAEMHQLREHQHQERLQHLEAIREAQTAAAAQIAAAAAAQREAEQELATARAMMASAEGTRQQLEARVERLTSDLQHQTSAARSARAQLDERPGASTPRRKPTTRGAARLNAPTVLRHRRR